MSPSELKDFAAAGNTTDSLSDGMFGAFRNDIDRDERGLIPTSFRNSDKSHTAGAGLTGLACPRAPLEIGYVAMTQHQRVQNRADLEQPTSWFA